jgi:NYN domain-containing protein
MPLRARSTHVYIDGFNLYYGALKGTPHKWLDLSALCRRLLPDDDIRRIRYFTARVADRPHNPGTAARQDAYLRALASDPLVTIHYGTFKSGVRRMPLAPVPAIGRPVMARVVSTEEKGSDVNLASYLLLDALRGACDTAVVVTNDSDLGDADHARPRRGRRQRGRGQPSSGPAAQPRATRIVLQAASPDRGRAVPVPARGHDPVRARDQAGEVVKNARTRRERRAPHPATEAPGGICGSIRHDRGGTIPIHPADAAERRSTTLAATHH